MPFEPGQQLLHYRLIEKIGEGGMGVVWKAEDTTLDRDVALKLLPATLTQDPERIARGALPPEAAIRIAVQITRGLEAAHSKGIVHRDLKPANIKFDADGQVKVLDFGLAREIVAEPEPDTLEHTCGPYGRARRRDRSSGL